MQTLQVNGREVKYRIRQGTSRKYVTLKFLSERDLEIVVPKERAVNVETLPKKKAPLIERKQELKEYSLVIQENEIWQEMLRS